MRGVYLICILLALPFLAAIGHDIYLAVNVEELTVKEPTLSDLGWLWVNYHPPSYNWALANTDPQVWQNYVAPLLRQTAVVVTGVPAATLYAVLFVLRLFAFWPFTDATPVFGKRARLQKGKGAFGRKTPAGRMKYKRK